MMPPPLAAFVTLDVPGLPFHVLCCVRVGGHWGHVARSA
jgi:hypothetical protein